MKYKKGDKVRVKKDLIEGQLHGGAVFYAEMSPLLGAIVTISYVFAGINRYHLSESPKGDYWTDEMLEDVEEDNKEEVKFEEGKWYKGEPNDYYFKAAGGVKQSGSWYNFIPVTEQIVFGKHEVLSHDWSNPNFEKFALENPVDLSEIQQYLPEGHPDKINTLEQSRESLLEEAKRRYPVGTRFISVNDKRPYTVYTNSHKWCNDGIDVEGIPWVYLNGRWAEIVEPPEVTEEIRPDLSVKLIPPIQSLLLRDGMYVVGVDPIDFESSKNKGESKSPTNESDFPIISTKRIINFSQLT